MYRQNSEYSNVVVCIEALAQPIFVISNGDKRRYIISMYRVVLAVNYRHVKSFEGSLLQESTEWHI